MLEQPGLKHRSRQMKLRRTFLTFTSFSFIFNVNTTLLLSYLWNCQLAFWAVCCIIEKHADEEDFFLSCICCLSKNIYKKQPQMYKSTHNFFLYSCLSVFIRNCGMLNFSLSGWYWAKTYFRYLHWFSLLIGMIFMLHFSFSWREHPKSFIILQCGISVTNNLGGKRHKVIMV